MNFEDVKKKLEGKPEIAKALEEALRADADAGKIVDILADAGIDANDADELLAECQRIRGAQIGFEDVDPEALSRFAGGLDGDPLGGCIYSFFLEDCSATVESGSWCWSNDNCVLFDSSYTLAPFPDN